MTADYKEVVLSKMYVQLCYRKISFVYKVVFKVYSPSLKFMSIK